MRIGRLALVVATLVAILVFPLMLRDAVGTLKMPSAYAASNTADAGGRVYQNGNNDDDDDDDDDDNDNNGSTKNNDNDDEEDSENDNVACYANLNDNEEVPCDFDDNGNYNNNDNYYAPPAYSPPPSSSAPAASMPPMSRCFGVGETGNVTLNLSGGSVVIGVVGPGLPQRAWLSLENVNDMSGIPTPPGGATMYDSMIWRLNSGTNCDGAAAAQVTGAVNLGIPYTLAADKSKLQIVYLQNGQWVEVPTSADPDPNKMYISATVQNTGIYAVVQKP